MGPNESNMSGLTIAPVNSDGSYGEPVKWEGLRPVMDFPEEGEVYMKKIPLMVFNDMVCCGILRLPHKKMSRKTFKKWLMSRGINRDLAEWFCDVVKYFKGKHSYQFLTEQVLVYSLFDTLFPIINVKETKTNG